MMVMTSRLVKIILTKSVTSHLSWWQGGESGAWEWRPPPPSSLFAIISVDITAIVVIIVTIINTFAISVTISTINIAIINNITTAIKVIIFIVLSEVKEAQLLTSFILTQALSGTDGDLFRQ